MYIAFHLDMLAHDLDRLNMVLPDQLVDSPTGHQPPLHDNTDTVTDHFDIVQNMRAEKNRFPLIAQTQNQVTHLFSSDRVQAGHRLIENHQFGIVNQRLSQVRYVAASLSRIFAIALCAPRPGPRVAKDRSRAEQMTARLNPASCP